MTKLTFLPNQIINPLKPLFIYLPGMDGSGKLLQKQTKLWELFNVRCLSFASDYIEDWDTLTNKTLNLIYQELKNNPTKKIFLCGESFGGCLAMKLIAKVPELFSQVILINPASSFYKRPWLNLGSYVTQIIPYSIYTNLTLLLLPFLAKLDLLYTQEKRALLSAMQSISPQIVSARINLINNFRIDIDKLKSFPHPVLIVASAEDKLLPSVEEAYRLQKLFPQTKISILPNSGHCCLLETNIDLANIIQFDHSIITKDELLKFNQLR